MLRDSSVGVLANESRAQWCSSRTRAPLQGALGGRDMGRRSGVRELITDGQAI